MEDFSPSVRTSNMAAVMMVVFGSDFSSQIFQNSYILKYTIYGYAVVQ